MIRPTLTHRLLHSDRIMITMTGDDGLTATAIVDGGAAKAQHLGGRAA